MQSGFRSMMSYGSKRFIMMIRLVIIMKISTFEAWGSELTKRKSAMSNVSPCNKSLASFSCVKAFAGN